MLVRAFVLVALAGFGLVACDSDGDGLTNAEEKDLGYDPKNEDMDGDGLLDGEDPYPTEADGDNDYLNDLEERNAYTDPANPDTDNDGYLDGDEVLEGTNPLDKKDKIYKGGWPYNRFKDDLGKGPDFSAGITVGAQFPNFRLDDQFGEKVNFYDYGGNQAHEFIVIDSSAEWCGPCRALAQWLSNGSGSYEAQYSSVRTAVDKGKVAWITVLAQDNSGGPTDVTNLENWDNSYPHHEIAVITGGEDREFDNELNCNAVNLPYCYYPTAALIDATTMEVVTIGGSYDILDAVMSRL